MIRIIKEISVEVSKPNLFQAIVAKQNDSNSRFLKVTLLDEGEKINVGAKHTVAINAQRKDGKSESFYGETNDDGTVTVPLHSWMLELDGAVNCDVSVIDQENEIKLTSTNFVLMVEKAANSDGEISEDPQTSILINLIEMVEAASPMVTPGGGEIFNDKENNIAGMSGFVITAQTGKDGGSGTYTLDSVEGLEVGDVYSVSKTFTYYNTGEITKIQSGNKVVVTNYSSADLYGDDKDHFFILAKPNVGTVVIGEGTHAEGLNNKALTMGAHAEGVGNEAYGFSSHTEGAYNEAGYCAHAEGRDNTASGEYSHAEGKNNTASGTQSHVENGDNTASGTNSHAEGRWSVASGQASHAEGEGAKASGYKAHAEGHYTNAVGESSHSEGHGAYANGKKSHAEGYNTKANGEASHAEGIATNASGSGSHTEGYGGMASGDYSHAEGLYAKASASQAHAEGYYTTASGVHSHAEGKNAKANGEASHAEGWHTIASGAYQHVQGRFNEEDTEGKYAHIVGGGTHVDTRKNIHTVDWNGNAYFAGEISCKDEFVLYENSAGVGVTDYIVNIAGIRATLKKYKYCIVVFSDGTTMVATFDGLYSDRYHLHGITSNSSYDGYLKLYYLYAYIDTDYIEIRGCHTVELLGNDKTTTEQKIVKIVGVK